jgi:predicted RNA-binding Zn-ribbon protein involved in translation (DUF1610 family)
MKADDTGSVASTYRVPPPTGATGTITGADFTCTQMICPYCGGQMRPAEDVEKYSADFVCDRCGSTTRYTSTPLPAPMAPQARGIA